MRCRLAIRIEDSLDIECSGQLSDVAAAQRKKKKKRKKLLRSLSRFLDTKQSFVEHVVSEREDRLAACSLPSRHAVKLFLTGKRVARFFFFFF